VIQNRANEFLVLDGGLLADKRAHEVAAWFAVRGHLKDPAAIEANWMAINVGHDILEAGRPRGPVMSFARFTILRDLYLAEGNRLSMTCLGQQLRVALANITRLVDGLVESGYVERIDDTQDKRKTLASLTPAGIRLMQTVLPQAARQVERNWAGLTEAEKKLLVHLLAKVRLSLEMQRAGGRIGGIEEAD
jgi:DNA-binding MarR family transcriptional regulator